MERNNENGFHGRVVEMFDREKLEPIVTTGDLHIPNSLGRWRCMQQAPILLSISDDQFSYLLRLREIS